LPLLEWGRAMKIDQAKLYVLNKYPKPDRVSEARWKAIVRYFKTHKS